MERPGFISRFQVVMHKTYLILGSNIQPRRAYLEKSKYLLKEKAGQILEESSVYSTEPWGVEAESNFLNQVILLETAMSPEAFLNVIHEIETALGRVRSEKYAPRTIDIDILIWDDLVLDQPELQIPHPSMPDRRFVLVPLAEIAPQLVHPGLQVPVSTLLEACKDQKEVFILAPHEPANSI